MKHMSINFGKCHQKGLPEALSKLSKLHVIWVGGREIEGPKCDKGIRYSMRLSHNKREENLDCFFSYNMTIIVRP